jgi:hypothetical protein
MTYIGGKRWITIIEIHIATAVNIHKTVSLSNTVDSYNHVQSAGMRKGRRLKQTVHTLKHKRLLNIFSKAGATADY